MNRYTTSGERPPSAGCSLDAAVAAEVRAEIARRKGASVSALAARLGMRRATLAGRVAGEVAFRPAELHHLARALDTSASAIVARAEATLARDAAVATAEELSR